MTVDPQDSPQVPSQEPGLVAPAPAAGVPQPQVDPAAVQPSGHGGSVLLGAAAGLGAGLVVAAIYAAVSALVGSEFLMLMVLIGYAVGFVVNFFTTRVGLVPGLVSLGAGALAIMAAAYFTVVAYASASFGDFFSLLLTADAGAVFDLYFSDPLGWVWVIVGLIAAFYAGFTGKRQR